MTKCKPLAVDTLLPLVGDVRTHKSLNEYSVLVKSSC